MLYYWPDTISLSRSVKYIVLIELTIPWEDRMDIAHELKKAKYQDLIDKAKSKGWKAKHFPVEVGCRGFPGSSLRTMLKELGIQPANLKKAIKEIGASAESCSRWLWLRRNDKWIPSP